MFPNLSCLFEIYADFVVRARNSQEEKNVTFQSLSFQLALFNVNIVTAAVK